MAASSPSPTTALSGQPRPLPPGATPNRRRPRRDRSRPAALAHLRRRHARCVSRKRTTVRDLRVKCASGSRCGCCRRQRGRSCGEPDEVDVVCGHANPGSPLRPAEIGSPAGPTWEAGRNRRHCAAWPRPAQPDAFARGTRRGQRRQIRGLAVDTGSSASGRRPPAGPESPQPSAGSDIELVAHPVAAETSARTPQGLDQCIESAGLEELKPALVPNRGTVGATAGEPGGRNVWSSWRCSRGEPRSADARPSTCQHTFWTTGARRTRRTGALEHAQQNHGACLAEHDEALRSEAGTMTFDEIERMLVRMGTAEGGGFGTTPPLRGGWGMRSGGIGDAIEWTESHRRC